MTEQSGKDVPVMQGGTGAGCRPDIAMVWSWFLLRFLLAAFALSGCARTGFQAPDGGDAPVPRIELTSLRGGEILAGGSTQEFTWSTTEAAFVAEPISLFYSEDGGATWLPIAVDISNTGSYAWTLPSIDSAAVRVRVDAVADDGSILQDSSASNIVVDSTPPVVDTLDTSPSGIVAAPALEVLTSVMDALAGVSEIQIRDGIETLDPAQWQPYAAVIPFTIGNALGSHALIVHVRDAAGNTSLPARVTVARQVSDVVPTIVFLTPAAGDLLPVGGGQSIKLHVHDNVALPAGAVSLYYSIDQRISWTQIASDLSVSPVSTDEVVVNATFTWDPVPADVAGNLIYLRAVAIDQDNNAISKMSPAFNVPDLRLIAGTPFDDNEVSAHLTMISEQEYFHSGAAGSQKNGIFVRDPYTHDIFLGDLHQGLRIIDGSTGIIHAGPAAGDTPVLAVDRDDFGKVYGCNSTGIYTWDRSQFAWRLYLPEPCEFIGAWRSQPDKLYWLYDEKLYSFDGSAIRWVAFSGTINQGSDASCYSLDPGDPRVGCSPTTNEKGIAVDANGNAFVFDNCSQWGEISACAPRFLYYDPSSSTVKEMAKPFYYGTVPYYRSYADVVINTGRLALLDEDPFSGRIYRLSDVGRIEEWGAGVDLTVEWDWWNRPASNADEFLGYIAGLQRDYGDGGPALDAHVLLPHHLAVGIAGGADADRIFLQRGNGCCAGWSDLRIIEPASEVIDDYAPASVILPRLGNENPMIPLKEGGFLAIYDTDWPYVTAGATEPPLVHTTGESVCTVSPADGLTVDEANWPVSGWPLNYHVGLSHSDGYVYMAGYAAEVDDGECTGMVDIFIKRFAFSSADPGAGLIEHVAGAAGAAASTENDASGDLARNFRFGGRIHNLRENLTAGGAHHIFIYQGSRFRMLERTPPDQPNQWRLTDVSQTVTGVRDFVLNTDINDMATSGFIYYTKGDSKVYRYELGSGVVGDLIDDTITTLPLGLTGAKIYSVAMKSDGELIFGDKRPSGFIYGYTP